MNNRTEDKLKDISGMSKAVNELLQQAWVRGYKYGLLKGYESGVRDKEAEQGEWIRTGYLGNGNAHYECSNCHYGDEHAEGQEVPYCWHCGAKMKEAENEQKDD